MKIALNGTGVAALGGLVIVVGLAGYLAYKLGPKLKTLVTKSLNPASPDNLVNRGVNAAVSAGAGYDETLGGAIADKVFRIRHPNFQISGPVEDRVNPTINPPSNTPGISRDSFDTGRALPAITQDPFNKGKTVDGDLVEPQYF